MAHPDLQIDWLRAFVAVVDAGSLTAAAPHVHRSQSALSMQLKKLEDAVGRAVLARGPRHLALTPAGTELLVHARRLLAAHAEAQAALRGPEVSGRLRLGVPDDYAVPYLTPVLRAYAARHARVDITLVCEQSTALIPRIARGEVDVAIVTLDRAQRGERLFREPLVWVGAAPHEAWRRDPLPLAAYETGSIARVAAIAALARRRRAHRIVYSSPSLAGQLAAVQSGLAVAVLTRCSVPEGLQVLGSRHKLPPLPALDVAIVRSKASRGSAAADALHEDIVRTLRRGP
jgi:DNA-binding transcriptional LysR family regulator